MEEVPVLVVGGGGAGLTASMLLSTLGIDSMLVSALPTTSTLPKAHILNQRAMEIMRDVGVSHSIYAVGTPPEQFSYTAMYAGFSGRPDAGRRLAKLECWGNGGRDADWVAASPLLSTNLPQIRLEPILRARAEELAPGKVRFHHELTGFRQDDHGVTATVTNKDDNSEYTVRCRYMIACDGGRTVGRALGVEMQGQRRYASQVSVHLSADFSRLATDDDVLIRWIFVPDIGAMVVLVPMGPGKWGTQSSEWVVHLNYPADDPRTFDEAKVEQDLRHALGIGDHPLQIHRISTWAAEGIIADRFVDGRVFLAGDAAHKHPPTGGLGLTSGMHDVQNLTWKIAAVLKGHAGPSLLHTYEPERRSSIEKNVRRSLENSQQWAVTSRALRVNDPDVSVEERWAHISRAWSGRPEDADFAREVGEMMAVHSMEFREHNIEFGYRYDTGALVPDGTGPLENPDPVRVYLMEARPGHPMPHAWVEDGQGGRRVSTVNLVRPGRFLLIAGEDGGEWCESAARVAGETGVPLDAVRIGHATGDWLDPRLTWTRHRGHGPRGAVLIRPDRFVAWRSADASSDPERVIRDVFAQVLGR